MPACGAGVVVCVVVQFNAGIYLASKPVRCVLCVVCCVQCDDILQCQGPLCQMPTCAKAGGTGRYHGSSDAGTRENASMRMYYVVALGFSLLAGGFNHNTGGASGSILECCPIARRFDSAQLQFLFLLFCFFANGGIQGLALVGYWQMPAFAN